MAGCVCILTVLHCLLLAFAKDTCSSPASPVTFEAPKTVQQGQGSSAWSFVPASQDIEVVVTPSNSSEDPDLRLYAASGTACKPVLTSQEIGGEYMRIARELTKEWNVSKYYLHVMCRREVDCKYHLAFSKAEGEWQEIGDGEERSGVAYHGVPSHFKFSCGEPCARALDAGQSDRVTFSAWPRDATSTKHLTLLVRFGQPPTTHVDEHLNATRGWFSGEVVNGGIQRGDFFITVLKRHGLSPLPFVVSVKLPSSVQLLKLGKPTFGSVNQHGMSFYKFFVDQADTDIEVYLTKLDGDPDCSLAHEEVNPRPSRLAFQWHSGAPGDDEITVPPDDPKRRQHTTGWFHVGVQSFEDATFSIIAFVEKHINASSDINQGKDGYVVQWTELWLGLPQAMAAQPGRPANFLFYSQLATSKLFVTVEALEGDKPDACVHKCGADPHRCPWLPIYLGETTRAKVPVKAVSFCREGELRGHSSDEQVVISKPCTNCWYAILVTTESNRSRFKIQLGAAGRAHPLVDGEAFKGSVDGGDACSLFVYDLSRSVAETRARTNATLQLSLTRIYGNPVFDVRKGSEDGQLLFSSSAFGDDSWSLALDSVGKVTQLSDTYYINVCASGRQHAQFRIQASWDQPLPSFDGGNALKLGFGMLRDGEAQSGSIFAGKRNIYLFVPATAEAKPSIRVSITSMSGDCSLFILAPREGDNAKEKIREFISNPIATADWKEVERSQPTILIAPSDAKYLPPTAALYIILVTAPGKDTVQYEITAAAGGLEELPTTGLPIRGQVKAKEYRRYRLVVAEADEHVSVQLAADVGDCDLYVGRTADVSSNNYDWRSEAFGSDWIFINGLGELNQKHCDNKTISEKNECVYFVAVKGVSTESDFTLQAIVPSAMVPLPLSETRHVGLPPGGIQYFVTPLNLLTSPASLQVSCDGPLKRATVKVVPSAPADLFMAQLNQADQEARFFAGVWSLTLAPAELRRHCNGRCDMLFALEADSDRSSCALSLQESRSNASLTHCELLEAGVPLRGYLQNAGSLCFDFRIISLSDVAVSVSPLADCDLQVKATTSGNTTLLHQHLPLRFVSQVLRQVRAGLLMLEVATTQSACQFDIRAQIADRAPDQLGLSQGESTALTLDAPVFASASSAGFFSFASHMEVAHATERQYLEVTVVALAGEVLVDCSYLVIPTSHSTQHKRDFLKEAMKAMQRARADLSKGSSQIYVCHGLREACGEARNCQLILRIQSSHPGRKSDFVVTAVDRRKTALLLPGIATSNCLGQACREASTSHRFQVFMNNPSTRATLRLSCQGPKRQQVCSQVFLSADARQEAPANLADRAYLPQRGSRDGVIEMEVKAEDKASLGRCKVPCVLQVLVEFRSGEFAFADYQLEMTFKDQFSLVLDGGMPLQFVAQPGKPEYFLFDARQTALSTLELDVPLDELDPEGNLVNMYIIDCASQHKDSAARPSKEHFSHRGALNSRWQLMATVANTAEQEGTDKGLACPGTSIAVISHRVHPVSLAIRGYGWHPGTPLLYNEPLEGFVDGRFSVSYEVHAEEDAQEFALDLEVCAGHVRLQTSALPEDGKGTGYDLQEGFARFKMPLKPNRWIQVSSRDGNYARFMILVQGVSDLAWLDADKGRQLRVEQRERSMSLEWDAVTMHGRGANLVVQYEVFYIQASVLRSNFATACGMYMEHSLRRAKRIVTSNAYAVIQDLEPDNLYLVNVVARSLTKGQVVAFKPWTGYVRHEAKEAANGAQHLFSTAALLLCGLLCFAWCCRQGCTGRANINAVLQSIELPFWRSSPQHYRSLEAVGRTVGSYSPPGW